MNVADEVFTIIEKYVRHLYGQSNVSLVNEARCGMFILR